MPPPPTARYLEDDTGVDGPFRTQIRLSSQLRSVCVLATMPEPPTDSCLLTGLTAEMSLQQPIDSDFSLLLDWFDGEVDPDERDIFLSSKVVTHYWINKQLFTVDDNNVLWKMKEGQDGTLVKLLVILNNLKTEIPRLFHEVSAAGHQGIDRTKARLIDRFFWYGMMRETRAVCPLLWVLLPE